MLSPAECDMVDHQTASHPFTKAFCMLFRRFNKTPEDLANVLSCVPGYYDLPTGISVCFLSHCLTSLAAL